MSSEIIRFVRARIAGDLDVAQTALAAAKLHDGTIVDDDSWYFYKSDSGDDPVVAVTPRRALQLCSAMSQIVDGYDNANDRDLRIDAPVPQQLAVLASIWQDHDDYQASWRDYV